MNRWMTFAGGLAALVLLSSGPAFGQQPKAAACDRARVPERVEGHVLNVDAGTSKVTIRDRQGTTHVFQSNPETVKDMKPGDRIEATLRQAPNC